MSAISKLSSALLRTICCISMLNLGITVNVNAADGQSEPPAFPKRKAGLWQIKAVGLEQAGLAPSNFCVGEATDTAARHLDRKPSSLGACTMGAFKAAQGGWLAESICKDNKTTIKSQAVLTGNLEQEYRIDTVVTYSPAIAGTKKTDQDSLVALYLGPCTAQQKPGDLFIAGMGTLNLEDGSFSAEPKPRAKKRQANR